MLIPKIILIFGFIILKFILIFGIRLYSAYSCTPGMALYIYKSTLITYGEMLYILDNTSVNFTDNFKI